ncbi:MAG: 4Fe-4S binding protein [Clostridia bacterium]|nr:4Fe-4S binding protein [Clostridia bacterium]
MKRIYVKEEWCLGCHLCEYECAYANSGINNIVLALKDKEIDPNVKVLSDGKITFAVSCRHCEEPLCISACISGALAKDETGTVTVDKSKCVGCGSCVMVCPYGAVRITKEGTANKCQLCMNNTFGEPLCVRKCPNGAIVYEEK